MPLSVLVVDDDSAVRRSLLRLLRVHGYVATGAKDGNEALRKALQHQPAVVIMDLLLPAQNGIEVAWAFRRHPDLGRLPIIALTASPQLAEQATALFYKVLSKPCAAQTLLHAIDMACGLRPT